MIRRLRELFGKKLQKVPHFKRKHEKSSIWPRRGTFFVDTTVYRRLGQLFSKRLQTVPYLPKKREKSSTWLKVDTFSTKLPCFVVWVNFSAKSCKKCLISQKSMKNSRFGQNLQLFGAEYHVLKFG